MTPVSWSDRGSERAFAYFAIGTMVAIPDSMTTDFACRCRDGYLMPGVPCLCMELRVERAPDQDKFCDRPETHPAWRVTRDGVCVCIAEAATSEEAARQGAAEIRRRNS